MLRHILKRKLHNFKYQTIYSYYRKLGLYNLVKYVKENQTHFIYATPLYVSIFDTRTHIHMPVN